jgi:hypothetical protein
VLPAIHACALVAAGERRAFQVSTADLTVGLVAAALAGVCVLFHYEVMSTTSRFLARRRGRSRLRIVAVILIMLLAHVVEVWFFGLTYWWLEAWPELGRLWDGTDAEVASAGSAIDFIYDSVVSYTTLGYGDLVPSGAMRILTGTEALVGLGLSTWTASFAFLQMQLDWAEFGAGRGRGTHPG